MLQGAMGWTDSHPHQFVQNGVFSGAPDREFGRPIVSERQTRVSDLLPTIRSRLIHGYDFGDGWEHEVVVEALVDAEQRRGSHA